MLDALWSAASGMLAQQTSMNVTANNLSNATTVGFKAGRASFQDLLYNELGPRQGGIAGQRQGLGVEVAAIQTQMQQGSVQVTTNPTDMRIDGNGFFQVRRADGQLGYTRAGEFTFDAAGQLVTLRGEQVQGPIRMPAGGDASTFEVQANGQCTALVNGTRQVIGQLQIATFANPAGLAHVDGTQFVATANSGQAQLGNPGAQGRGGIAASQLEMSNVSAVDEMVNMITTQRAFEGTSKAVQASDDMLGLANGLRR